MQKIAGINIENPEAMSELERLEAAYEQITNTAIRHLENDLQVATAMKDDDTRRLYQIQISMYRHNQSIFNTAKKFATGQLEI